MAKKDELFSAAVNAISGARLTENEIELLRDASVSDFIECGIDMDNIFKALSHAGIENNRLVNQDLYDPNVVEESLSGSRIKEIIQEELQNHYTGEPEDRDLDYPNPKEGHLVKTQLYNIARNALQLHESLGDNDNLPAWCIQYIGQVGDKLDTVTEYLEYKILQTQLDEE
jgi:hypothetical protein